MDTSPHVESNLDQKLSEDMSKVKLSGAGDDTEDKMKSEVLVVSDTTQHDAKAIKEQESVVDNGSQNTEVDTKMESENHNLDELKNTKLQVISQYMALVRNSQNHSSLLKENTITGFLVLCLGDDIPEVVESSLEVFLALSKREENLPVIKNLDYIMDALRCVASNSHVKDVVRKNAKKFIAKLKESSLEIPVLSELSDSMKNVMASTPGTGTANKENTHCTNKKPAANLNSTMSTMKRKKRGRETILFLENGVVQQELLRARITEVLVGVAGIISVTYNLNHNFCIIRGKRNVASEDFGRAVAELGFAKVYLVRKNENNEEVKTHIPAGGQENMMFPPYPEEQENEEIDNSAAVANKIPADDASFFKSAKDFIKRSFYW